MICPECNSEDTMILETRHNDPEMPRRRRACGTCGARWTTREIRAEELLRLQKLEREMGRLAAAQHKLNQITDILDL